MKYVARNELQLITIIEKMRVGFAKLGDNPAMLVEFKKYVPPRTDPQRKKLHAMIGDLAEFTGDSNMKEWVKGLSFWPDVYIEHAGVAKTVPKSEALLSKEESSVVIEHLYVIGSQLPGFEWSEPNESD